MGDDTRAAFDGAPCAIAVAPCHYSARPRSIRSIAVGYEGTPESEQALAAARYVADRTGAVIVATWVVVLQKVQAHGPLPADWDADTAKLVEQCQEHLDGIEGVIGHAVYGGPREELSRVSSGHDLVVVGSRAHGAWGHLFHGSVSSYLEHHCAAPLMIMARDLQTEHRPAIEQTAEPEAVTR